MSLTCSSVYCEPVTEWERKKREMGKGGKGEAAAAAAVEGENMAAWLVAKNTLKIMPFKLPPLGLFSSRPSRC